MVPNPKEVTIKLENPIRDAAIHFGAFLQRRGLLKGGEKHYGTIEQEQLLEQFTNYYQPQYNSHLVRGELLRTLLQFKVILKNRQNKQTSFVRVIKHPDPHNVKEPGSKPRPKIYVDQTRVLRDGLVRTEVLNKDKCCLCNASFSSEQERQDHQDTDLHKFKLQYREKRSSFKSVVGNASMNIVGRENNGDMILRVGEHRSVTVKVTCGTPYTSAEVFKIIDLDEVDASPLSFNDDVPIEVNVTALFTDPGAYLFPLVAKVMPARLCLLKDLVFRVESELVDQLAPTSPFVQREDVVREMVGPILPGEELPKAKFNLQVKVGLGHHQIPTVYNSLLLHKLKKFDKISPREEAALDRVLCLLCGVKSYKEALHTVEVTKAPFIESLNKDNYSERFALLLDLEELQQQHQIKYYDRSDEKLIKCNRTFLLNVPDLSEGKPSVTKGDKVHVRLEGNDQVTYEGVIHEIREQGILLGFHQKFNQEYAALKDPKVDVHFTVNRFPILNMHRALNLMSKHQAHSIVFPQRKGTYQPPTVQKSLKWVNKLLESNPEQQRAVKNIISGSSGSAPYLVFGPPGTGKTVTLVEAIVQVWLGSETMPIKQLVSAPSNAACDNITKRLLHFLPKAKILRLYSLSTDADQITDNDLLMHSNYDPQHKQIYMPTMNELMANDIIVSTLVTSGRMVTGGAEKKFQYVFIDECGQASEPEALIAIAGLLTSGSKNHPITGQLVLAGDPLQLGPVLSSTLAKDFGLGMSLLERLMNHVDLYKKTEGSGYDSNYLTKLVQNFRSHPAILQVPNQLFYDGELQVKGVPEIINTAVGWDQLRNKNLPIIFHGVQGLDERESNSPSYFNRHEIDRVVMYIEKLFQTGLPNYKVKQEDIGIITPYRKQVQKFKKVLGLKNWTGITVGSVEQFQGSEKLIIFISTVRSSVALVEEDYRFKLGFLKNPKRFNVAVTRAKALLIVVGNPNILRYDKQWYQLLKYCRDNGATAGVRVPLDDSLEEQFNQMAM